MDKKTVSSRDTRKQRRRQNEKKKKETDETLDEVCRQMNKLAEEEGSSSSSNDSEELANSINYNTITSLAALKDIIQGDSNDNPETDSFFQHYFMNHCNNLSSRAANTNSPFPFAERRRLSQCREEDEDGEPPPSAVSSACDLEATSYGGSTNVLKDTIVEEGGNESKDNDSEALGDSSEESKTKGKRTVMGARHKFLVSTAEPPGVEEKHPVERILRAHHNAHTVHFGTRGAEEQRPSVRNIFPGQNLRHDKNYFDSSLIEIRSTVDELPDLEEIWVKRPEDKKVSTTKMVKGGHVVKKVKTEFSTSEDKKELMRERSGTWGAQSPRSKEYAKKLLAKKDRDIREDRRQRRDQRLDAAVTRSTQSFGERRRLGSADDGLAHLLYQQTIHGTSGVSRRPALFDIFKSKRSDVKKQPSIMQQVKAAVQSITKSSPTTGRETPTKSDTLKPEPTPGTPVPVLKSRDGSAHPHPGSDTRYYHTVTAAASRRPSAMAKVIDIFRGRASSPGVTHSPLDPADRRKAKKRDNSRQTGSAGGTEMKVNEIDELVYQIIGSESPVLDGIEVTESLIRPEAVPQPQINRTPETEEGLKSDEQELQEPSTSRQNNENMPPPPIITRKVVKGKGKTILRKNQTVLPSLKEEKLKLTISYLKLKIEKTKKEIALLDKAASKQTNNQDEPIVVDEEYYEIETDEPI